MGHRLAYWIFLGTVGLATFFVLRPAVDFNAGEPIQQSRTTIESKTSELARELGFSTDSLNVLSTRSQHLSYYKSLKDSLGRRNLPDPASLNSNDLFLSSWMVTIGGQLEDQEGALSFSQNDLFNRVGRLQLRYDDTGKVRRAETNPRHYNPTFVPGDSLLGVAQSLVRDILDYNLTRYRLTSVDIQDTSITTEPGFNNQPLNFSETNVGNNTAFYWQKIDESSLDPTG